MGRPQLEVADIVRSHAADFVAARRGSVTSSERLVLQAIADCRTSVLGGHVDRCDRCGHQEISYNSCRNRHCPKCQASARAEWTAARQRDLLPVEYFHVVFSVPKEIASIALQNKAAVYGLIFQASAQTLREVAADPRHLGAEIGVVAVLHTWGQTLQHHPHVHCVVPGGGISEDRSRWVSCRPGFFLPVRVLSRVFRGKFLDLLRRLYMKGELTFHGQLVALGDVSAFRAYLAPLYEKEWVVYAKPPFGGPTQVLKYLARYTHRVAISNGRLVGLEDGNVSFKWKDYAHRSKRRVMTLCATEFLRRFLLHILPKGFVRIRHLGFLANRCRKSKIELCRDLLSASPEIADDESENEPEAHAVAICPSCKTGRLVRIEIPRPHERVVRHGLPPPALASYLRIRWIPGSSKRQPGDWRAPIHDCSDLPGILSSSFCLLGR